MDASASREIPAQQARVHTKRATNIARARRWSRAPTERQSAALTRLLADAETPRPLRVGILDRDTGFVVVLSKRLQRLGWQHCTLSSKTTTRALAAMDLDVLIVDLGLLGAKRSKWLADLSELCPEMSIVVCTCSSTVAERVHALRLGASDWVTKPCHPEELIARIEAVRCHHRRHDVRDLEPVIIGEVEVRPDQYQAFVAGRSLRLTRREYQLIELLSQAGSQAQPRELIYECLWGYEMTRNDRSVDVFVHKLRRKLERASPRWRYIHTEFRVGYRLVAEPLDGTPALELQVARGDVEQPLAA